MSAVMIEMTALQAAAVRRLLEHNLAQLDAFRRIQRTPESVAAVDTTIETVAGAMDAVISAQRAIAPNPFSYRRAS